MKRRRLSVWSIILVIVISMLCISNLGCSKGLEGEKIQVELRVTQNLGEELIFGEVIGTYSGSSVLDLLDDNLDVDITQGGFINSIEGLESGFTNSKKGERHKRDWFYFVNGTMANIGSGDYVLKSGDIVWWDYHSWDGTTITPVVSGAFPQPFVGGYSNVKPQCKILYGEGFKEEAQALKSYLEKQGAVNMDIGEYDEDDFQMKGRSYIILETCDKIENRPYWQDIMERRQKVGWFAEIKDGGIIGYDILGGKAQRYEEDAGAVLVSGQGMGSPSSIWLFTATADVTLRELVSRVIEDSTNLKDRAGTIYHENYFIPLPLR